MPEPTRTKKSRPKRNQALLPAWWLEVTPHYTLDLDDENARRMMEERMAMQYSQLVEDEAAKGLMFDIDGNLIEGHNGADGTSSSSPSGDWKSNWTGRKKKGDADAAPKEPEKPKLFGGRNFKPGSPGWDPKQWGIDAKDLDYDKYLRGSLLPPQFIVAMNNFAKATGHFKETNNGDFTSGNNLKTTEGAYGRSAEQPAHVPDWMKKKLRSTKDGAAIRHGIYDDSPNRHWKGRDAAAAAAAATAGEEGTSDKEEQPQGGEQEETSPSKNINLSSEPTTSAPPKMFSHKDYYYNSTTSNAPSSSSNPVNGYAARQQQQAAGGQGGVPFVDPDSAEYEEELVDEEEYEEVEFIEDSENPAEDDGNLEDLQATLASKMEELERLQAT